MYMRGSPERWQFTGTAAPYPLSSLAPRAREPGLPLARQAFGPVVVRELFKSGGSHKALPGFQIVIRAVAPAVPALLVVAVRVRAEQHAARLERRAQLAEHARQLLARNVEQHRIREHAVEARIGQIQAEQILPPHLAAAVLARHDREGLEPLDNPQGFLTRPSPCPTPQADPPPRRFPTHRAPAPNGARTGRCHAPSRAFSRSTISKSRLAAICRGRCSATSPAVPRPTRRCARTAHSSTRSSSALACWWTSPGARRRRRSSAAAATRPSASRPWAALPWRRSGATSCSRARRRKPTSR